MLHKITLTVTVSADNYENAKDAISDAIWAEPSEVMLVEFADCPRCAHISDDEVVRSYEEAAR